ncbi:MAG: DUF3618 domain-containing protein [Chloroflexota bacterium]
MTDDTNERIGDEIVGYDEGSSDPEVEEIVSEIEVTRDELAETVAAIGTRLEPSNVVADAKEAVRDATVGKVERTVESVTSTAGEMAGNAGATAQQAGSGIMETIRRNPVPALMTGIGIGWLFMNRSSGTSSSSARRWTTGSPRLVESDDMAYPRYGGTTTYQTSGTMQQPQWQSGNDGGGMGDQLGQTASQAGQRLGQTADQAGQRLGQTADRVGQTAGQLAGNASDTARQLAGTAGQTIGDVQANVGGAARHVGWSFQQVAQESPLALGAIAVAVGTAVGLALPATQAERQVLQQPAQRLIGQAEQALSRPMEQMEQQARQG